MGLPARSQRYLSAKSVFFEAIANRFFKFWLKNKYQSKCNHFF
jgi:hypothetical protein